MHPYRSSPTVRVADADDCPVPAYCDQGTDRCTATPEPSPSPPLGSPAGAGAPAPSAESQSSPPPSPPPPPPSPPPPLPPPPPPPTVSGNTPETTLVFVLTFAAQPSQSHAVVQTAVQYSIASANTPLPVSTSVVDVGSAAYNVTVLFPAGAQVFIDLLSDPYLAQIHPIAILCHAVDPARHTLLASLCCSPVMELLKHMLHMTKNPFPTS